MKTIKLMPDYECFPLWHCDEEKVGDIDPASIGISQELVRKLSDWQSDYDATLDRLNGENSGFPSKEKEIAFVVKGYELAKELKCELINVNVVYFDIDQLRERSV
ncbi:MAG: hypothetical protein U1F46_05330 [Marinagarivorans sp.]